MIMFKKGLVLTTLLSLVLSVNLTAAKTTDEQSKPFRIKSGAVEIADGVFSLGKAYDAQTHELVEGYAIVHKKKGKARPSGGSAKAPACYGYLANGAKWKNLENWTVNPANEDGLTGSFVAGTLSAGIAKWEDGADGVVGNELGVNILGDGSVTNTTLVADQIATDGQ